MKSSKTKFEIFTCSELPKISIMPKNNVWEFTLEEISVHLNKIQVMQNLIFYRKAQFLHWLKCRFLKIEFQPTQKLRFLAENEISRHLNFVQVNADFF